MNIAIIGSRTFNDYSLLKKSVDDIICKLKIFDFNKIVIISGGANGADSLAAQYARERTYQLREYIPDWNDLSHSTARIKINRYGQKYDANAGHRRNTLIIDESDIVIAFHNDSPGTCNSLQKAYAANKPIYEFKF